MKRDINLIREILIQVEDDCFTGVIPEYEENIIIHHVNLLIEAGFLKRASAGVFSRTVGSACVTTYSLTWDGHEFIANLRKDNIWNKVKDTMASESVGTISKVAAGLALKSFLP